MDRPQASSALDIKPRTQSTSSHDHPNSFQKFSESVRRASQFRELQPVFREVVLDTDETVDEYQTEDEEEGPGPHEGDLAQERDDSQFPWQPRRFSHRSTHQADETTPLISSGNDGFVPLGTHLSRGAKRRIENLNKAREEYRKQEDGKGFEPFLVKVVERSDGTRAEVIVGQSTVPQTIFNSTNVLMGVGMLGLPLGIAYAGWVFGIIFLIGSAVLTKYTTGLLAKCLDVDSSLSNYADIAFIAFGEMGRYTTSVLFTFELIAANVALVILLAGTLGSLIPSISGGEIAVKVLCGIILTPTCFLPLRILSYSSFVGVFAVTILIILLIIVGGIKDGGPGSLREIATTWAFPLHWRALPLSFGLIMSPWGGQSVFPQIYRDMRHPMKYNKSLNIIYSITTIFDLSSAVIGFLMFGAAISDEITKSVLQTTGYPYALAIVIMIMVAMMPLTKFALNNTPIVNTMEVLSGIDHRAVNIKPNRVARSKVLTYTLKAFYRLVVCFVIIVLAVLVPNFEMISALMGAFFCFLICVILPIVFHLRMFWTKISIKRKIFDLFLVFICLVMGVCGTAWEFIPKSWVGIE